MPKTPARKPGPRKSKTDRIGAILDAARAEFEEAGYEDAKMSDIARRIGVVEGTVFHYFASKKLLMARIIEDFYREITARLRSGLAGMSGTRNRLHYIIRFHLEIVVGNSRLCGEILHESRRLDGELARAVSRLNQDYTRHLSETLEAGIRAGEIASGVSIPLVRNTVYGSIEHTLWAVIRDGLKVDIDRESELLTALVYRGIADGSDAGNAEISALVRHLNRLLATQSDA